MIAVALASLLFAQAELAQLKLGQSERDATVVLERQGATVLRLSAEQPQALRQALIDGRLLETWNLFALTPRTKEGGLDPKAFQRLVVAEAGGRRWVLAFSRGGLTAALGRYPVPIDASADPPGGWSPRRLDPLRRALQALGPLSLTPVNPDPYGNHTTWKGRAAGGTVRALYRPAEDELLVLLAEG